MWLPVQEKVRRRLTLERLGASRWPPITALCLAAAVFVGVLLVTPPGLLAPLMVFSMPALEHGMLSAAYAAGTAASLALLTLVIVGPLLAVLDALSAPWNGTNERSI